MTNLRTFAEAMADNLQVQLDRSRGIIDDDVWDAPFVGYVPGDIIITNPDPVITPCPSCGVDCRNEYCKKCLKHKEWK